MWIRLLYLLNAACVLQISNRDLLHAVVGLYDACLADMTPDCIYDTICEKWARTIVLVRDLQGTYLRLLTTLVQITGLP